MSSTQGAEAHLPYLPGPLRLSKQSSLPAIGAAEAEPGGGSCLSAARSSDQVLHFRIFSSLNNSKRGLASGLLYPHTVLIARAEDTNRRHALLLVKGKRKSVEGLVATGPKSCRSVKIRINFRFSTFRHRSLSLVISRITSGFVSLVPNPFFWILSLPVEILLEKPDVRDDFCVLFLWPPPLSCWC